MNNCVLYISPNGRIPRIHDTFKNSDVYYVTHDNPDEGAMSFNKGCNWAYNRNYLAENITRKYDYYIFIDYDVVFHIDNVEEAIEGCLEEYYPAVMTPVNAKKEKVIKGKIENNPCTNNHIKIVHHSLVDYFFPMPCQFGGFWDCCCFFNVLASAFRKNIIHVHDIPCSGLVSSNYSHNSNPKEGHKVSDDMFNWLKPSFGEKMLVYKDRKSFEAKENAHDNQIEIEKNDSDIVYKFDKSYVDIDNPIFSYRSVK